ncbi:17757_t:CDS:2, partial [Funneliformis caledonium]
MTDYALTEPQRFTRQQHNNYNNQVGQNWEASSMPAQEMQNYEQTVSSTSVNNWVMHGNPSYAAQGNTYQANGQNGISSGYGTSVSEQPSTNHVNVHRTISNSIGISVNTSNLPVGSANVISTDAGKIICVADVRGNISQLNQLAKQTGAIAVIHSGDFGFYENNSLDRISDRTLRHLVTYSTIIPTQSRNKLLHNSTSPEELRRTILESPTPLLSEFPLFMKGDKTLDVPVYTVWGACEDVTVLEKFRMGHYKVHNLFILDEANTYVIDVGGVSLRLFGLGGAVVQHKLFDNGDGIATIAGGHGTMWTTILQIGELVDTAQKVFDPTETRVLVTHASPGREGLLAQLSVVLRADFTISAGLHFHYGISYNDDSQRVLLQNALTVVDKVPSVNREREEPSFKNMWNFNLPDAAFGWVLLDIKDGRVSAETKAQ